MSKTNNVQRDTFKKNDPGFLVAKGNFRSDLEHERTLLYKKRDELFTNGASGDDARVVALTNEIAEFDQTIDREKDDLERQHVKQLAKAIFMALSNCGYANVRSIGHKATHNACKSLAIAAGNCKSKGIELCWEVCFDEGNIGQLRDDKHVSTVTALLFKVRDYKDWAELDGVE